ncbi:ABC transporter ATP-binding protein [Oceanicella sp. SM1341]|uniref:ABC transporter ATP-binding protein n=1 Tax=Oceanicella sp. SM1341 TaxID=1548889 RepID=UPI000E481405|nr:ABC transporter ATP-binding protein [Oceanicella sp. SM1341]
MSEPRTGLAARGLTLGYGRGPVVDGLDLAIPPGRFTALLGPNGCGKSTALRGLAGAQRATAGQVLLDGRAIATLGSRELARQLGVLTQSPAAPEGLTVDDLVRQGRYPHRSLFGGWSEADSAALEEAYALTGTGHLRARLLDTLSGGQRQRAWIAMTLAQQGRVLLLDEPTTYLDLAHQIEVLGLMHRLVAEGRATVVAVLHDLNQAARYADHLVMMKAGRIRAEGPPSEVLTPEAVLDVFGVAVTIIPDPECGTPLCIPRAEGAFGR